MAYSTNLYVIAAICGNFWQESTVNPGIWEGLVVGNPGYGLGQWTDNSQVSRRTALFDYLDNNGYARDSGYGQLKFLIYEDIWVPNGAGYPSAYNTLTEFLQSTSTNITDLTMEWFHHWEGIDDGTGQVRVDAARRYLQLFFDDNGVRVPWHASNAYLSVSDSGDNSLHIMDFFLGGSPPDPPDPPEPPTPVPPHTRRKGLPPWLIAKL